MIAVSTYSGECDGLGYAAEMAGIEVVAYCEADPKRRAKLAEKHPGKPIFTSDEELTADALYAHGIYPDILFGGPPCQPFSCAGSRRGTADSRHRWPEMLRLIRELRPRWVLVENVRNFVNLALDLVWDDLEEEGYEVGTVVLPALAIGAPHRRDRCFVVAHTGCCQGRKDTAPCGRMEGSNAVQQRAEGAGGLDCGGANMEYAQRSGQKGDNGRRAGPEPANGCEASLADTQRTREPQPRGEQCERGGWAVNGGEGMANAESTGFQVAGSESRISTAPAKHGAEYSDWRSIESRMGGVLDGISDRLDAVMRHWPAWRGQEQHPWEPPRTITGLPERSRRVESLGLAVVPLQAYPIMALIKEMDDMEAQHERREG